LLKSVPAVARRVGHYSRENRAVKK